MDRGRPPLSHSVFSSGPTARLRKRSLSRSAYTEDKTKTSPAQAGKDDHAPPVQHQQQQQPMFLRRFQKAVTRIVTTGDSQPTKTNGVSKETAAVSETAPSTAPATATPNGQAPNDAPAEAPAANGETARASAEAASEGSTASLHKTATASAGAPNGDTPAAAARVDTSNTTAPTADEPSPSDASQTATQQPPPSIKPAAATPASPGETAAGSSAPAKGTPSERNAPSLDLPRSFFSSIKKLRHTDSKRARRASSRESQSDTVQAPASSPSESPEHPTQPARVPSPSQTETAVTMQSPRRMPSVTPDLSSPPLPPGRGPSPTPSIFVVPPPPPRPCPPQPRPASRASSAASSTAAASAITDALALAETNVHAMAAQLAAAHQQIAAQAACLRERDAAMEDMRGLVERLRARIQEQVPMAALVDATTLPVLGIQIPDGQLRTRWKSLRWQVRQCVEGQLATGSSTGRQTGAPLPTADRRLSRSPPPSLGPFLRRLTPDYHAFLQSRTGTVHLLEAAVWAVLADSIFASDRDASRMCWAAHWSNTLAKIHDNMLFARPFDPAFHHWRAHTAAIVLSQLQADGEHDYHSLVAPYADAVVRQLEAEVGTLMGGGAAAGTMAGAADPEPPTLRQQLLAIVNEAIALDADLCQQRAFFFVHFPVSATGSRYGMRFNPHDMEAVQGGDGASSSSNNNNNNNNSGLGDDHLGAAPDDVTLVVRPGLYKSGISRGTNYEQAFPMEPSIVCRGVPSSSRVRRMWYSGRDQSPGRARD